MTAQSVHSKAACGAHTPAAFPFTLKLLNGNTTISKKKSFELEEGDFFGHFVMDMFCKTAVETLF